MEESFVIEPLGSSHSRAAFHCGVEQLDRYIRQLAKQDQKRRVAAIFVAIPSGSTTVAGYYTLSSTAIVTQELPPELIARFPRHELQPASLLGRLAVDQKYRDQGLGGLLLASALRRSLNTSADIGAMAVVVDAIDESARQFYAHHDFRSFPDRPLRLYYLMTTIAEMFGE